MGLVDPDAGEHGVHLAHGVHRHAGVVDLLEVGAPRRLHGVVVAARGALERARLADERPRDHAPDRVLAGHDLARLLAVRVELLDRHDLLVRGDLEHRVGRRVDDQIAGLHVLGAEVGDHLGAAVGAVAEDPAAGRRPQLLEDLLREAVAGRSASALGVTTPIISQWPVIVSLPGPSGCSRPWSTGDSAGGTPAIGRIEPSPSAAERRQVEAAGRLGDVRERARTRVAVLGGVRQLAGAAGVEHDHEGPAWHGRDSVSARAAQAARRSSAALAAALATTTTRNGARSRTATTATSEAGGARVERRALPRLNVCVAMSAASSATGSSEATRARARAGEQPLRDRQTDQLDRGSRPPQARRIGRPHQAQRARPSATAAAAPAPARRRGTKRRRDDQRGAARPAPPPRAARARPAAARAARRTPPARQRRGRERAGPTAHRRPARRAAWRGSSTTKTAAPVAQNPSRALPPGRGATAIAVLSSMTSCAASARRDPRTCSSDASRSPYSPLRTPSSSGGRGRGGGPAADQADERELRRAGEHQRRERARLRRPRAPAATARAPNESAVGAGRDADREGVADHLGPACAMRPRSQTTAQDDADGCRITRD